MKHYSIQPFIEKTLASVQAHALPEPGTYRRWLWQDHAKTRDLENNPYGCADAVNILYSIQAFPSQETDRIGFIQALQRLQNPEDGMFSEPTHHPIHTTAHCIAALELFDQQPLHPLHGLDAIKHPEDLHRFLEQLDWQQNPWSASHQGAGIYAALVLAREVGLEWEDAYFSWLNQQVDETTGFWRVDCIFEDECAPIFHHLAGSFHYLFNYEYAKRPIPHPKAMIDTCLDIFHRKSYAPLGRQINFAEIDWVFCLTRASRQTSHRFDETREALHLFMEQYIPFLLKLDTEHDEGFNDIHSLFGTICALAELQQALPGVLRTDRPLRLVLDRRPFI
jgi:hypothetical protein